MKNDLIIIGASGHGKVLADIAKITGYTQISFLDDDLGKTECAGFKVIGSTKDIQKYKNSDFIVGIGDSLIRKKIQTRLSEAGLHIVSLIHPRSVVAEDAVIGAGTVVTAGAIVNPSTVIGEGCIINTGATVDHDNKVSDFTHIAVGSHLAGGVQIGKCTLIGAGSVVINNLRICDNCIIGAGAVVIQNIEEPGTYIGTPAKKLL